MLGQGSNRQAGFEFSVFRCILEPVLNNPACYTAVRYGNHPMTIPVSRRLDFAEIPIIDLSATCAGGPDTATVDAIQKACTEVGFFYLVNHGVAAEVIAELVAQAKVFFALPEADKRELLLDQRMRGYLPLYYRSYEGEERAGTSHQEGFWIGYDTALDSLRPLDGPNQWPSALPQLRSAMLAYLDAVEELSQRMLRLFAGALELPVDTLLANFTRPTSRLKLNHYPLQQDPVSENNIGVVPHSDSGCFTILWQDHNGGLEVQNEHGDWVGAPPLADSFVVNIGNILQYWSNGRFSSTPHRVINRNGGDRYSIPFFVNPDFGTVIRPLADSDDIGFEAFEYGKYQVDLWRNTFPLANIP
jgi:isopenicillin N synthase-like dioxygenase